MYLYRNGPNKPKLLLQHKRCCIQKCGLSIVAYLVTDVNQSGTRMRNLRALDWCVIDGDGGGGRCRACSRHWAVSTRLAPCRVTNAPDALWNTPDLSLLNHHYTSPSGRSTHRCARAVWSTHARRDNRPNRCHRAPFLSARVMARKFQRRN